MTARVGFVLGLAYGISLGMALKGLMDYGEALAHRVQRPVTQPVVVDPTGRKPA